MLAAHSFSLLFLFQKAVVPSNRLCKLMVSKSGNSFSCRDGALFSSAFHGILPVLPKDHNAPKRNTAPSCLAFAAPRHSLQNHAEGFHQLHDTSRQTYDAAVLPDAYHHPNGNSETDFAAPLPPAAD